MPLGEPDPAERLRLIRTESAIRKTHHDAQEMDRALAALSRVSPRLRSVCDRKKTREAIVRALQE